MKFKRYLELRNMVLERLTKDGDKELDTELDMQTYAFLGDSAYTCFVRKKIASTGISSTRVLHDIAARIVSAKMQSKILLSVSKMLSEKEHDICRRARNLGTNVPGSATMAEYKRSTAWEALIGYHMYHGNEARAQEIMQYSFVAAVKELRNGQK